MRRAIRYSIIILAICALLAAIVVSCFITGFSGFKNSFRGDTEHAKMQLTISGVKGDLKGLDAYIQNPLFGNPINQIVGGIVPTLKLPMGAEAVLTVSLPIRGIYHVGGGWVLPESKYYGKHPVTAKFLSVESRQPDIVDATLDRLGRLKLKAISPGKAIILLSARRTGLDGGVRTPPMVTDSVEFTVLPTNTVP